MAFVFPTGDDPETASGFDWVPKDEVAAGLFAQIAAEVHAVFRVDGR